MKLHYTEGTRGTKAAKGTWELICILRGLRDLGAIKKELANLAVLTTLTPDCGKAADDDEGLHGRHHENPGAVETDSCMLGLRLMGNGG
jgi:hypothetical protein